MRVEFLAILVETQRPPKQSFVWYLNIWIWTSNAALDAFNNMTCIPLYVQKPPVELKSHNVRVGIGYPWQSLAAHKTSVKNAVIVSQNFLGHLVVLLCSRWNVTNWIHNSRGSSRNVQGCACYLRFLILLMIAFFGYIHTTLLTIFNSKEVETLNVCIV